MASKFRIALLLANLGPVLSIRTAKGSGLDVHTAAWLELDDGYPMDTVQEDTVESSKFPCYDAQTDLRGSC